ncbi:MAG TPA: histidine phosphatase family protein [Xanthobacteraceae bacterium]|jgi:probable phosphoglycerate mutase|nr:histidine phosphatase family protein [Xanthobacteraceae bacterium]
MTRPVLYYVRHGETDWNVEGRLQGRLDPALNDAGRRQAAVCADILRDLIRRDGRSPLDYGYVASPLQRARQTVEIMRAALGLAPGDYRVDARLREIGFGEWEGLTFREVRSRAPQALAARERDKWAFVPPGGESYAQVALRMREWYDALAGDTVVVAHGGTARALIAVLGVASPAEAPSLEIGQGIVYRFANGSMSRYG